MGCNAERAERAPITGLSYQAAPLWSRREVSRSPTYLLEFVNVSDSPRDAARGAVEAMSGWDVMQRRERGIKDAQVEAEQLERPRRRFGAQETFAGAFLTFQSQVKRRAVLRALLQSGGWMAAGTGLNIIFSHKMKTLWLELFIHRFQGGTARGAVPKRE